MKMKYLLKETPASKEKPDFEKMAELVLPYRWSEEDDPTGQKRRDFIEDFTEGAEKGYSFGVSFGGRDMMRLIIDMLKAKKERAEHDINNALTKDVDLFIGQKSAFKEIIQILERQLNMLEHKKDIGRTARADRSTSGGNPAA